jgi:hypothetical protein
MPFLGITGLDENYERVIAPNDDNDHGLARIIAKNTLEPVCVNIKKNVVQTHDKHVDEPDDEPDDGLSDYISKYRPADKWSCSIANICCERWFQQPFTNTQRRIEFG